MRTQWPLSLPSFRRICLPQDVHTAVRSCSTLAALPIVSEVMVTLWSYVALVYSSGPLHRRSPLLDHTHSKRGSIQARLVANPYKPTTPSIVLTNVHSLDNKLDHIHLLRSTQQTLRECCVFVSTETWLNNSIPDSAIQLDELTCYRADRALIEGGKTRGGGVCVYISDAWCQDTVVVCKHCSPLAEFMIHKCDLSIYRGSLQPSCSPLFTSPPALTTTTETRHWANCTVPSASNRPPIGMDFSLWLATLTMQTSGPCFHRHINTLIFQHGETTHWTLFTQPREEHTRPHPSPTSALLTTSLLMPAYRPRVKVKTKTRGCLLSTLRLL